MLQARGVALLATGIAVWIFSAAIGSVNLRLLAGGLVAAPLLAWLSLRLRPPRISVARTLSSPTVQPGATVEIRLELTDLSRRPSGVLLVDDASPLRLGPRARAAVAGIPPGGRIEVSSSVRPPERGVYPLGPATIIATDPFGLAQLRIRDGRRDELVATPRIERLDGEPRSTGGPVAGGAARRARGAGREFAAIRAYEIGDDLRRIHWPSVARTGDLMIRQDEAARGSDAEVFLDTRSSALGRPGSPAFERAASVAASFGVALAGFGYALTLAAPNLDPARLTVGEFLTSLGRVTDTASRRIGVDGPRVRARGTLVTVTAPPTHEETAALIRAGAHAGPRIAAIIVPEAGGRLSEERSTAARRSLARAGWTVLTLRADMELRDAWHRARTLAPARIASSR